MKQTIFMALATTCLIISSCTKKTTKDQDPQTKNTVTIEGTDYATAKIGTQTWTAVNYNGTGGVNYSGSPTNDAVKGKLYTIAEAKAIALPSGWRIPTSDDYMTLYVSQGSDAKKLMAKSSWTLNIGTNNSGFNAISAGYYEVSSTPDYDGQGTEAVFITTSYLPQYNGIPASFVLTQDNNTVVGVLSDYIVATSDKGSIRFVRNN